MRALCSDREVMAMLYGAHLDMTDGITGVENGIELRGMVARPATSRLARHPAAHRFLLRIPEASAIELKDGAGYMVFGKVELDPIKQTLTVTGPLPVTIRIFTTADEFDLTVEDKSVGRWRDLV